MIVPSVRLAGQGFVSAAAASELGMEFALLRLGKGEVFADAAQGERLFLLIRHRVGRNDKIADMQRLCIRWFWQGEEQTNPTEHHNGIDDRNLFQCRH